MTTDAGILAAIEVAFRDAPKPEHFTNHTHCEECAEHDQLLRRKDRDTLQIEDVGNIGWQPISFCSPEGMAYYMPALARLALSKPTYNYGWYGETLAIHLSSNGRENAFLRYCNDDQRKAVANLLRHLKTAFPKDEVSATASDELDRYAALWSPSTGS